MKERAVTTGGMYCQLGNLIFDRNRFVSAQYIKGSGDALLLIKLDGSESDFQYYGKAANEMWAEIQRWMEC